MGGAPLISAIIPVFDGERYLGQAIDSALAQTYRPLEVVVIDDGSTDGSAAVARRYPAGVECHRQPHGGIGAARNRGAGLARGAFFAFLDADDLWTADKLERQAAALAGDARLDMVFGAVRQFVSPELDDAARRRIVYPDGVMAGYHPGAMLIRRDSFFRVGPFRTDCRVGEFIDWYARAMELGLRAEALLQPVMWRRLHAANQGIRQRQASADYLQVLKAALERRRAAARGDGSGSAG